MSIYFGNTEITNIPKIKFGSTDVQEVYWGADKIWPSGPVFSAHFPLSSIINTTTSYQLTSATDGVVAGDLLVVNIGMDGSALVGGVTPDINSATFNGEAAFNIVQPVQEISNACHMTCALFLVTATSPTSTLDIVLAQPTIGAVATVMRFSGATTLVGTQFANQGAASIVCPGGPFSTVASLRQHATNGRPPLNGNNELIVSNGAASNGLAMGVAWYETPPSTVQLQVNAQSLAVSVA